MKGTYYFSQLSSLEQSQFRRNTEHSTGRSIDVYLNDEFRDFREFISSGFSWMHTEEGLFYWHDISNKMVREDLIAKRYIKKVDLC